MGGTRSELQRNTDVLSSALQRASLNIGNPVAFVSSFEDAKNGLVSLPNVAGKIQEFQDVLRLNPAPPVLVNDALKNFVTTLPPDLHQNVRSDIEALATRMLNAGLMQGNLPPLPPASANPPTPTVDPLKKANEAEMKRREDEKKAQENFQIAAANYFHSMSRKTFEKGTQFKNDKTIGMESGIKWHTDIKIEDGIYGINNPENKSQKEFWLEVKSGVIQAGNFEKAANAIDFFRSKGVLDISVDFDKPGPYSMKTLMGIFDYAKSQSGIRIEVGAKMQGYLLSGKDDMQGGPPMPFAFGKISRGDRKAIQRQFEDFDTKQAFDKFLADRHIGKKNNMTASQMAGMQLMFLIERHNEKALLQRANGDLPSFQQAVNYKAHSKDIGEMPKIKSDMDDAAAKKHMFGDDHADKPAKEQLANVSKEMDAIEKRLQKIDGQIESLNKRMDSDINKYLKSNDSNQLIRLSEHLQVIGNDRATLIEAISAERADLVKRMDFCAQELTVLETSAGLTASEKQQAQDLQKKRTDWNAPAAGSGAAGLAAKVEAGLEKAQRSSEELQPEKVNVVRREQQRTEHEHFNSIRK